MGKAKTAEVMTFVNGPERRDYLSWANEKKTPHWQLRGAECQQRWGIGQEVTEAQFDSAIELILNTKMGGGGTPIASS